MVNQTCAICEVNDFKVLYKENFDIKKIDEKVFSARRLPDKIHYRIVRCKRCGLVYSTPILDVDKISKLYKKSFVDYDEHIENLIDTYGFYLKELEKYHAIEGKLLEIGCGNGFMLMEGLNQGYEEVYGIEPGKKSVEKAPKEIQKKIVIDIFRPGQFRKNFFDVICCFQTLDHVPDPNGLLAESYNILKKGGLMLFFNHDVEALSAKLFGERSPIIDIEHTYLYSKKTMRQIFEKHRFKILKVGSPFSIHTFSYWMRLFPMPKALKLPLISFLNKTKIGKIPLKLLAGNVYLIAQK